MIHPWTLLQRKMRGETKTTRLTVIQQEWWAEYPVLQTALIEPSYALDLQQSWEYTLGFVAVVCYVKHVETPTER